MPKFNLGWLKDKNGEKFAPKTFIKQVISETGKSLQDILDRKISSPLSAEVGQYLIVKDVDENCKPIDWEYRDVEIPEQVQSDYSQNDSTQSDYIQNRPFYSYYGDIIFDKDITLTYGYGNWHYGDFNTSLSFEDGQAYELKYNGNPLIFIPNNGNLPSFTFDGMEIILTQYRINVYNPDNLNPHITINEVNFIKINENYIPDNYIKNDQYATTSKAGLVRIPDQYGLTMSGQDLKIRPADNADINEKTNHYNPIVPRDIDKVIKSGLSNNKLTWTEEEKKNARDLIGAVSEDDIPEIPGEPGEDGFSPIATVEQTDEGVKISIEDKNGTTTASVKHGKDGKDGNAPYIDEEGYITYDTEANSSPSDSSLLIYNAKNYEISEDNEDNTPALQELVDLVHENGGGIIYFPIGTYCFKKSSIVGTKVDNSFIEFASIWMKSNVSIIGENMNKTVFKQIESTPYAMFAYQGTKNTPIIGCSYKNFTVDAYETAWSEETGNKVYSKAFAQQYLKDCIFNNIILKGTLATALGVDYLDNVRIKNITLIDCGRAYDPSKSGRSGIGIGTGGWENENFTIHNCTAIRSGQYGVFVENQTNLNYGGNTEFSKGSIISNCIVRDGMNKGIGIVGGQNITVIGCQIYDNEADGIYIDGKCKNITVTACNSANNGGNGVAVDVDDGSRNVIVANNYLIENGKNGIEVLSNVDSLVLEYNHSKGNAAPLKIGNHVLHDAAIQDNSLFGDVETSGFFTGNTAYNDLIEEVYPAVGRSEFLEGIKIMPDGSEYTQSDAMSTDFIDISKIDSEFKLRFSSAFSTKYRVCQYDADKVSFYDNDENPCPMVDAYDDNGFIREKTFEKLEGASYIRIFVSKITDVNFAIEVTGKFLENMVEDGAIVQSSGTKLELLLTHTITEEDAEVVRFKWTAEKYPKIKNAKGFIILANKPENAIGNGWTGFYIGGTQVGTVTSGMSSEKKTSYACSVSNLKGKVASASKSSNNTSVPVDIPTPFLQLRWDGSIVNIDYPEEINYIGIGGHSQLFAPIGTVFTIYVEVES